MKVAIIGSRTTPATTDIADYLAEKPSCIISGGAKGADTLAKEYARANKIPYKEFLPNYTVYGKTAPLVRNKDIIDNADYILAFWDGKSKGTAHALGYAKHQKKPFKIVFFKNPKIDEFIEILKKYEPQETFPPKSQILNNRK